uniref:uncharacterized protein isoform X2 n=1 Tax=Myxine glutinosa TaxID=7769 RepID=UPI00358FC57F
MQNLDCSLFSHKDCSLYGKKQSQDWYVKAEVKDALHLQATDIHHQSSMEGKTFNCCADGCSEMFSDMQLLINHMRVHHKPNRFFKCERCSVRFCTYRSLLKHLHVCLNLDTPAVSNAGRHSYGQWSNGIGRTPARMPKLTALHCSSTSTPRTAVLTPMPQPQARQTEQKEENVDASDKMVETIGKMAKRAVVAGQGTKSGPMSSQSRNNRKLVLKKVLPLSQQSASETEVHGEEALARNVGVDAMKYLEIAEVQNIIRKKHKGRQKCGVIRAPDESNRMKNRSDAEWNNVKGQGQIFTDEHEHKISQPNVLRRAAVHGYALKGRRAAQTALSSLPGVHGNRRVAWTHTRGRYTCVQCPFSSPSRQDATLHAYTHRSSLFLAKPHVIMP